MNAVASFNNLLSVAQLAGHPLYLLLDEYDNFTNEIALGSARNDRERYEKIVTGDGALKTIFKKIKAAVGEGRLDRYFITGGSPMLLSDLTSGFNTATDISLERTMHALCGFTEAEIHQVAQQISEQNGFDPVQQTGLTQLMRTFYNGYAFHPAVPAAIYNPTLARRASAKARRASANWLSCLPSKML